MGLGETAGQSPYLEENHFETFDNQKGSYTGQ